MAIRKPSKVTSRPRRKSRAKGTADGYVPKVIVKFSGKTKPASILRRITSKFPGASVKRLFTLSPARIRDLEALARRNDPAYKPADFSSYFVIHCPAPLDPFAVVREVSTWDGVTQAYFDPPCSAPAESIDMSAVATNPSLNFSEKQDFLEGETISTQGKKKIVGVNARYAWKFKGGDGTGQHLVDLEKGWYFCHKDLAAHFSKSESPLLAGINGYAESDHGTKVLGVICGRNPQKCIGITPNLKSVRTVSYAEGIMDDPQTCVGKLPDEPVHRADAIMWATKHLVDLGGGVLLLEAQTGNVKIEKKHPSLSNYDLVFEWLKKFHPIEILPADFKAIQLATACGIIVVEAAGNGAGDLKEVYENEKWKKLIQKFTDDTNYESGAIMVAAADRDGQPIDSVTNHGERIDCFARGAGVYSTNIPDSSGKDKYVSDFNGTSSASAIIAGVALSVLGLIKENNLAHKNAKEIRELLKNSGNGWPSIGSTKKIGIMPDLKKIIKSLGIA